MVVAAARAQLSAGEELFEEEELPGEEVRS